MSLLILDEKRLTITVKCKLGESFTPNEEVKILGQRMEEIKAKKIQLDKDLTRLLEDCIEWNRRNDEEFNANIQKRLATIQEKNQKAPETVSESGEQNPTNSN